MIGLFCLHKATNLTVVNGSCTCVLTENFTRNCGQCLFGVYAQRAGDDAMMTFIGFMPFPTVKSSAYCMHRWLRCSAVCMSLLNANTQYLSSKSAVISSFTWAFHLAVTHIVHCPTCKHLMQLRILWLCFSV